jgi:predicted nuclease of restriction endonuclease-like RecB superfamily
VEIAGDRRLGHGLATVCLDWYRWTARTFAEELPPPVAEWLAAAGVETPSALRLRLFDVVNDAFAGFVPSARREEALALLAASFDLDAGAAPFLDRAMLLDAEAEAMLTPAGPPPSAADLIARYNRALLAALLRQAERIVFKLASPDGALVRRLYASCRRMGVYCDVEQDARLGGGFRLTLSGPEAVVGPPAAAGPRLAAAALGLLRRLDAGDTAAADLTLHDRPYRLALDRALLRVPGLGADEQTVATEGDTEDHPGAYDSEVEARFARSFAALRRQGRAAGWRMVREPAPLLAGARVLIPDFALDRDGIRVFVEVIGFWTPGYIQRKKAALAKLKPDVPLVLTIAEPLVGEFIGLPFPVVPYRDDVPVHRIVEVVEARHGGFERRTAGAAARLEGACDEAGAGGWIDEEALSRVLGCYTPGEVARVLASAPPPAGWEYVPGAGLASATLRETVSSALTAAWGDAPASGLTLADLRMLVSEPCLPADDQALVALLSRLPGCVLAGESLFDVVLLPPGEPRPTASAAPAAGRDRPARPPKPRRRVAESLPLF